MENKIEIQQNSETRIPLCVEGKNNSNKELAKKDTIHEWDQNTSEECGRVRDRWDAVQYTVVASLCVREFHAGLGYLTSSFPVPSQKHGL